MQLATLCYVQDDGKTLMMHRVKKENDMHEGKWNGLGGKIEEGETPEKCVIREVKEESGLEIYGPQLEGFLTFPAFDGNDEWRVFVYTADDFQGELIESREGRLEWIEDENLLDLNLWEGDRHFLPWLERDGIFSARFVYEGEELQDYDVAFH
jgi:8-oxo-dGTP diphosphatase